MYRFNRRSALPFWDFGMRNSGVLVCAKKGMNVRNGVRLKAWVGVVVLLSAPSVFAANPAIAASGVKNAASYSDPALPNGAIAQGSIFNVFGSNMGPASLAYASALPLPTTLSGTQVSVTVNGSTVQCFMIYTSAGQVAAILPSTTPVGTGTITVSYNGAASATAPIKVATSSFGIFTINQQGGGQAVVQDANYNFNSATFAFQPGETVVLWGTGLGPISGSDANTPPSGNIPGINVTVYGRRRTGGRDLCRSFGLFRGRSGCVYHSRRGDRLQCSRGSLRERRQWVQHGGQQLHDDCGGKQHNLLQPEFASFVPAGARFGRHCSRGQPGSGTFDACKPAYSDAGDGGCRSRRIRPTHQQRVWARPGSELWGVRDRTVGSPATVTETQLDGGPVINVNGPNGAKQLALLKGSVGSFSGNLGGGVACLDRRRHRFIWPPEPIRWTTGPGGKDVGAFKFNLTVPPPLDVDQLPVEQRHLAILAADRKLDRRRSESGCHISAARAG